MYLNTSWCGAELASCSRQIVWAAGRWENTSAVQVAAGEEKQGGKTREQCHCVVVKTCSGMLPSLLVKGLHHTSQAGRPVSLLVGRRVRRRQESGPSSRITDVMLTVKVIKYESVQS